MKSLLNTPSSHTWRKGGNHYYFYFLLTARDRAIGHTRAQAHMQTVVEDEMHAAVFSPNCRETG